MAKIVWAEPALDDLDQIAEYIALDKPDAASRFVEKVFSRINRLKAFPNSDKRPAELDKKTIYRELVTPPCKIFYRAENKTVLILHILRSEAQLKQLLLDERIKNL